MANEDINDEAKTSPDVDNRRAKEVFDEEKRRGKERLEERRKERLLAQSQSFQESSTPIPYGAKFAVVTAVIFGSVLSGLILSRVQGVLAQGFYPIIIPVAALVTFFAIALMRLR